MFSDRNTSLIMSYKALRRLIGLLGMALPVVCVLGGMLFAGSGPQESVSYYYHTNMRDWFIGLMFVASMFMLTYKGPKKIDDLVTSASGICGLGLAVFPCVDKANPDLYVGIFQLGGKVSDRIHIAFAALFFILLACNSFFLFTKSKYAPEDRTIGKNQRNVLYRACGVIIFISLILLLILSNTVDPAELSRSLLILLLESIMLFAFGLSWLVKGETLFRD